MLKPEEIKLNRVLHGKNQDVLKDFPDSFFDSVITDPPYELGFMSKAWDASGVAYNVAMWKEVLRVVKPGATLFCFGGTRTYHRVACAIEDAGWQLKDSLVWLYGSGFPKSTNISKQLDKEVGATREVIGRERDAGSTGNNAARNQTFVAKNQHEDGCHDITTPATDLAKQWNGYGTALKPAFEPIILAMKPLEKGLTYAQNARKWGVAGLNIDAGRIGTEIMTEGRAKQGSSGKYAWNTGDDTGKPLTNPATHKGRWPANVILSHSPDCVQVGTQQINGPSGINKVGERGMFSGDKYGDESPKGKIEETRRGLGQETIDVYACVPNCPIRIMDTQSGQSKSTILKHNPRGAVRHGSSLQLNQEGSKWIDGMGGGHSDSGGASRFFYTAKASRSERESGLKDFVPCVKCGEFGTDTHTIDADGNYDPKATKNNCIRNDHCTVKPVAIMKYLCELIRMPVRTDADGNPDGNSDVSKAQVILDPFCGSGATLLAADEVGLKYIGIDMGIDNVLIASSRSIDTPPDDDEPVTQQDPADIASSAQQLSPSDFDDLIL